MEIKCPNCGALIETDLALDSVALVDVAALPASIDAAPLDPVPSDGVFQIGDRVTVRAPFDKAFPGSYAIDATNPETGAYQIAGDRDFSSEFLQLAERS